MIHLAIHPVEAYTGTTVQSVQREKAHDFISTSRTGDTKMRPGRSLKRGFVIFFQWNDLYLGYTTGFLSKQDS
jgi:hypothetical protein